MQARVKKILITGCLLLVGAGALGVGYALNHPKEGTMVSEEDSLTQAEKQSLKEQREEYEKIINHTYTDEDIQKVKVAVQPFINAKDNHKNDSFYSAYENLEAYYETFEKDPTGENCWHVVQSLKGLQELVKAEKVTLKGNYDAIQTELDEMSPSDLNQEDLKKLQKTMSKVKAYLEEPDFDETIINDLNEELVAKWTTLINMERG